MSFPRRRESRINISWITFCKGMTRRVISFAPILKGENRTGHK
ncbi:MAG: hypothetical protein SFT68_00055 [Rickettsiaceae bacterium]|nr:hypothetical protein [Rickettsiaceae bacterium]